MLVIPVLCLNLSGVLDMPRGVPLAGIRAPRRSKMDRLRREIMELQARGEMVAQFRASHSPDQDVDDDPMFNIASESSGSASEEVAQTMGVGNAYSEVQQYIAENRAFFDELNMLIAYKRVCEKKQEAA